MYTTKVTIYRLTNCYGACNLKYTRLVHSVPVFEIIVHSFVYNGYFVTDSTDGILYDYCVLSYTQSRRTVLHHAAEGGSTSLIECCINAGINVNVVDKVSDFIVHTYSNEIIVCKNCMYNYYIRVGQYT